MPIMEALLEFVSKPKSKSKPISGDVNVVARPLQYSRPFFVCQQSLTLSVRQISRLLNAGKGERISSQTSCSQIYHCVPNIPWYIPNIPRCSKYTTVYQICHGVPNMPRCTKYTMVVYQIYHSVPNTPSDQSRHNCWVKDS